MSKFRNKVTNEIVEANSFTELFAFLHNSNYELVETKEDKPKSKTKTKEDTDETAE